MATGDVINGSDVYMFFSPATGATSWTCAAHATSHTLSLKRNLRATSNKGTGDIETSDYGRLQVTGSLEGMCIDADSNYGYEDFVQAIYDKASVMMMFAKNAGDLTSFHPNTTTGGGLNFYASGIFVLDSVDKTDPDDANSTYTVNFTHKSGFVLNEVVVS
jgi:hypothetical protein